MFTETLQQAKGRGSGGGGGLFHALMMRQRNRIQLEERICAVIAEKVEPDPTLSHVNIYRSFFPVTITLYDSP